MTDRQRLFFREQPLVLYRPSQAPSQHTGKGRCCAKALNSNVLWVGCRGAPPPTSAVSQRATGPPLDPHGTLSLRAAPNGGGRGQSKGMAGVPAMRLGPDNPPTKPTTQQQIS